MSDYDVIVSNAGGIATSAVARLLVSPSPVVPTAITLVQSSQFFPVGQLADAGELLQMVDKLFQAEHELGEDPGSDLMHVSSVFDSFERSDQEASETIAGNILVVEKVVE